MDDAHVATAPWAGVAWWTLVGALAGFVVLALLSVGVFVAPLVVVLGAGGLVSARLRRGMAPGLPLGLSTAPLWLAWLNRSGPGTVCETTATSQACSDQLSPWPLLGLGLVLAAAGLVLAARAVRAGVPTPVQPGVPGPS
ncbi:hypothetical protein ACK8HX_00895 [Oryzobacter sp. R7]|uniref:hypothetical protein n=1 Tax=Oryzobacter faecalis TaxID=3388656 RepID=UPI00398CFE30